MEVGPAHAARKHTQQNLVLTQWREDLLFGHQTLPGSVQAHRKSAVHLSVPCCA
jgi:hypothetical protein